MHTQSRASFIIIVTNNTQKQVCSYPSLGSRIFKYFTSNPEQEKGTYHITQNNNNKQIWLFLPLFPCRFLSVLSFFVSLFPFFHTSKLMEMGGLVHFFFSALGRSSNSAVSCMLFPPVIRRTLQTHTSYTHTLVRTTHTPQTTTTDLCVCVCVFLLTSR